MAVYPVGAVSRTSTCCPAAWSNVSERLRKKLLIVGVLVAISTIAQLCHRAVAAIASVIRISLLIPGIAVHVVPAQLPEAGLVSVRELKTVHPLRRLPEVEMRHEQARRPPVVARQRLAFVLERDHGLPRCEVGERHVGGVSVVAMYEYKPSGSAKASVSEDVVDGHALPSRVELRPRGHAVDIARHPGSRERIELRPAPRFDGTRSDLQREGPIRGIDPRRGSGRKHREIVDEVLSRRNPVRWF